MKRRWLGVLLSGLLLSTFGVSPSTGASQKLQSLRPNVPKTCWWHEHAIRPPPESGQKVYHHLHCKAILTRLAPSRLNVAKLERDSERAVTHVVEAALQSSSSSVSSSALRLPNLGRGCWWHEHKNPPSSNSPFHYHMHCKKRFDQPVPEGLDVAKMEEDAGAALRRKMPKGRLK